MDMNPRAFFFRTRQISLCNYENMQLFKKLHIWANRSTLTHFQNKETVYLLYDFHDTKESTSQKQKSWWGARYVKRNRWGAARFQVKLFGSACFLNCNWLLPDVIDYGMSSNYSGFNVIDYKVNVIDYKHNLQKKVHSILIGCKNNHNSIESETKTRGESRKNIIIN